MGKNLAGLMDVLSGVGEIYSPVTRNEKTLRAQAFAELFGPELTGNGFIRHRNNFYRVTEDGFVQSVCFAQGSPLRFIHCDILWVPGRHGVNALLDAPFERSMGTEVGKVLEPLQSFISTRDPQAEVGGNIPDMTMGFDAWLRRQHELFVKYALPILNRPCDLQEIAGSDRITLRKVLALLQLQRWDEAEEALTALHAAYAEEAEKYRGADDHAANMTKAAETLLDDLRSGDRASAEAFVRRAQEHARQDVTAFSKKLGAQFRCRA